MSRPTNHACTPVDYNFHTILCHQKSCSVRDTPKGLRFRLIFLLLGVRGNAAWASCIRRHSEPTLTASNNSSKFPLQWHFFCVFQQDAAYSYLCRNPDFQVFRVKSPVQSPYQKRVLSLNRHRIAWFWHLVKCQVAHSELPNMFKVSMNTFPHMCSCSPRIRVQMSSLWRTIRGRAASSKLSTTRACLNQMSSNQREVEFCMSGEYHLTGRRICRCLPIT